MVLVYSDDKNLSLELLNKGRELAGQLGKPLTALVIGGDDTLAQEYITRGADQVVVANIGMETFNAEEYTEVLTSLSKELNPVAVLIGSNKNGKELASRLAAQLKAGCAIDCTDVYLKDKNVTTERMVYSGNAIAVEQFSSKPGIVTIPSKVFEPLPKDDRRAGNVVKKSYKAKKSGSKIVNVQDTILEGVNVEEADIIVSCGRGFKNKEDIRLVEDLAEVLKGKTIGCSRPIAADLKWLSEEHWIGLSGHKVKPKLYIAAGISGQIQHIAGMRDSKVIVAINKDPEALIFKFADYGIVGDLYEVLPKLTEAVKAKMS
jgi:electron transfer flavoprotein alpha subunit